MNKNTIKKFAIEARKKLIDSVTDKAGILGITEKSCSEPITKGPDFEIYQTIAGTEVTLNKNQCEQRKKLVSQIESHGFEAVVEEVAYTWFNRICAIRFMEVNDYLPNRVRVLSSEKEGKMEPDLVTLAPDVDLNLTVQEKEEIINWKMSGTSEDTDKLYCKLFLKQCHQLHDILPGLFEANSDYMELLFGISYTNKDDVIYMLVNPETGIPEADFNVSTLDEEGNPTGQVEIIGWLYQYYNTELKDDTFAKLKKNIKITKERIPAATQLFTPDWIVRYMVENSVGRIWIEHLRAVDPSTDEKVTAERFGWKYYLPEAEQEEAVNVKLAEIRTTYKDLKPTDITCIDPCMGSGHILIAMFDVLMDIYESVGYDKREAAFEIVEHNIYGLDIDQRAYQLAYFAVMMKGRQYDRRFFSRGIQPHAYAIAESGHTDKDGKKHKNYDEYALEYFCDGNTKRKAAMDTIISELHDAKEYGSILTVTPQDWSALYARFAEIKEDIHISREAALRGLLPLVQAAEALAHKYDVVVTNPPYMGASGMSVKLSDFVKKNYPDSKSDLFAVCIERGNQMVAHNGINCMVTMQSWMFLSSFEKMRINILQNKNITNLMHMENMVMGIAFGTAVTAFRNCCITQYKGTYNHVKYEDIVGDTPKEFPIQGNRFAQISTDNFSKIPGSPVAYWLSDTVFNIFATSEKHIGNYALGEGKNVTTNNARYILFIWEVSNKKIGAFDYKWLPCAMGGERRKWYGNIVNVIDWSDEARTFYKKTPAGRIIREEFWDLPGVTWGKISSGSPSFRILEQKQMYQETAVLQRNIEDSYFVLTILNTKIPEFFLKFLAPTVNFQLQDICAIPVPKQLQDVRSEVTEYGIGSLKIAKRDWDSFETSWDFQHHPLLRKVPTIAEAFDQWQAECNERFNQLKANEEELNRIFIDIYGLQDELTPEVEDKDVTVRKADLGRDIRSFLSYVVGCMFGRYSLYNEGILYAGGAGRDFGSIVDKIQDCLHAQGKSRFPENEFYPDRDNIIPICDDEYFEDDIVSLFVKFVKTVYGADTLEENLDFIASALGNKGDTSREVIRNYFLKDFYADHLKVYQKRPIYWLFDSGKQNGFKALIYMHRYDADTVGRVRTDYLHRAQKYVETAMQSAQYIIENATSASEKSKATKAVTKYTKQLAEMKIYDEAIAHIANKRTEIDLDDGVKINYEKFQGVEVAQEGKKALKVDLLANLK